VLGGKMEYFQYYGIDWVAVGYLTGSVAMIIANIIFFSMNLRAIIKWSTPEKEPKVSVAEESSTS
ncbi:aminotransferase, partial [Vibrio parahaemolyticus]|nr:aminotransferase [Vibrio parahaemolyticus]